MRVLAGLIFTCMCIIVPSSRLWRYLLIGYFVRYFSVRLLLVFDFEGARRLADVTY